MPRRLRHLLSIIAACAALFASVARAAEPQVNCAVEAVEGQDASLWSKGEWRPLSEGVEIPRDAIVLTGDETRARIECSDGLRLTVGVATQINLETVASQRESRVAQLVKGVLGVFSPRRARESFMVRTPVADTSLRGAEALIEVTPDEGAATFVRKGDALVSARDGQSVTLTEGEGVTVDASGTAEPVKIWGAARIAQSAERLGFDWR